jgi:outer membrane protein TolC
MVVPTPPLITAEELAALRAELDSLRAQVETLTRQKANYVSQLERLLRTSVPIPPTEDEILAAVDNSDELRRLIADLESR